MLIETHTRSIVKMISYRLTAWLVTMLVTYWVTHDWEKALSGSIAIQVILTIYYYIHERIWLKVKWGVSYKFDDKPKESNAN